MRILNAGVAGAGANITVGLTEADVRLLASPRVTSVDKQEAQDLENLIIERIIDVLRGIR